MLHTKSLYFNLKAIFRYIASLLEKLRIWSLTVIDYNLNYSWEDCPRTPGYLPLSHCSIEGVGGGAGEGRRVSTVRHGRLLHFSSLIRDHLKTGILLGPATVSSQPESIYSVLFCPYWVLSIGSYGDVEGESKFCRVVFTFTKFPPEFTEWVVGVERILACPSC